MPRGRWTAKDDRMYDKIFLSCRKKKAKRTCYKIAAATVNKHIAKQCRLGKRKKGCTTKLRGSTSSKGLRGTRHGIEVVRIRLNKGGYDSSGRYFGVGEPLYWWQEEFGDLAAHVRAKNAAEAREKALEEIERVGRRRLAERESGARRAYARSRGWSSY